MCLLVKPLALSPLQYAYMCSPFYLWFKVKTPNTLYLCRWKLTALFKRENLQHSLPVQYLCLSFTPVFGWKSPSPCLYNTCVFRWKSPSHFTLQYLWFQWILLYNTRVFRWKPHHFLLIQYPCFCCICVFKWKLPSLYTCAIHVFSSENLLYNTCVFW
jgi:hypothetical protein